MMMELDRKNCLILNLLQEDCRMSLTEIARRVGLSIDSVKKRIVKMRANGIFFPKIQIRPRNFGFKTIVDIKIKVHDCTEKELKEFVSYIEKHPRVAEFFSISGEWNFSIVIIAEDFSDLAQVSEEIRGKFGRIIGEWTESLTTRVYKFEKYDMLRLIRPEKRGV
jgi:DNA-binding Lrp family transcriptional regulator